MLFGGSGSELVGTAVLGDTWEWDGANWTQVADLVLLRATSRVRPMTAERRQTVIFGGATGPTTWLGDTWGWDGSNWTQLADSGPSTRYGSAMAFDTGAQHKVLYGGSGGGAVLFADTWEWDGAAWTQVAETGPPARAFHLRWPMTTIANVPCFSEAGLPEQTPPPSETLGNGMAPSGRRSAVSAHRRAPSMQWPLRRTAWRCSITAPPGPGTGRHWTLRQDFGPSPHRTGHAMCYDSKRASLAVFGGTQTDGETLYGDTWEHSEGTTNCRLIGLLAMLIDA